jgi:predicted nucleotidyltransferase
MSKKIDIIALFLGDYLKNMNGREISRLIHSNHQTALNHLNELVREKILKYLIKGRNKEYCLDISNIKTKMMLEIAESANSMRRLENKEINVIMKEINPFTESIILFGSFSSGNQHKKSDIDIVLIGKSDKKAIEQIKKRYNREINIEFISYSDFIRSLKQKKALAIEIIKNHTLFGDVSKIIKIFIQHYIK